MWKATLRKNKISWTRKSPILGNGVHHFVDLSRQYGTGKGEAVLKEGLNDGGQMKHKSHMPASKECKSLFLVSKIFPTSNVYRQVFRIQGEKCLFSRE
jgi:hypothetical protein